MSTTDDDRSDSGAGDGAMKGATVLAPSYPGQDWLDGTEPCREVDPEVFFPPDNGSSEAAKRICRGCAVKEPCAEYAVATSQTYGIWGGLSAEDRGKLTHRQRMQKHRAKKTSALEAK